MKLPIELLVGLDSKEIASEELPSYEYSAAVVAQALLPTADELPDALLQRLHKLAEDALSGPTTQE